jgi:hypothetical protein
MSWRLGRMSKLLIHDLEPAPIKGDLSDTDLI